MNKNFGFGFGHVPASNECVTEGCYAKRKGDLLCEQCLKDLDEFWDGAGVCPECEKCIIFDLKSKKYLVDVAYRDSPKKRLAKVRCADCGKSYLFRFRDYSLTEINKPTAEGEFIPLVHMDLSKAMVRAESVDMVHDMGFHVNLRLNNGASLDVYDSFDYVMSKISHVKD